MNQIDNKKEKTPIFNLPFVVVGLVAVLWVVYGYEYFLLDEEKQSEFVFTFAFIPVLYLSLGELSSDWVQLIWSPFTHALMHASWEHLALNSVWLAIFGTPVARRYGAGVFLLVFFITALAGALFFALTTIPSIVLLIGASGGVSGLTGVAIRFIFQPTQIVRDQDSGEVVAAFRLLASFSEMMKDVRARSFILVWVGLNAAVPLMAALFDFGAMNIAWQAHLGGFFAGLFIAPLLEKRG